MAYLSSLAASTRRSRRSRALPRRLYRHPPSISSAQLDGDPKVPASQAASTAPGANWPRPCLWCRSVASSRSPTRHCDASSRTLSRRVPRSRPALSTEPPKSLCFLNRRPSLLQLEPPRALSGAPKDIGRIALRAQPGGSVGASAKTGVLWLRRASAVPSEVLPPRHPPPRFGKCLALAMCSPRSRDSHCCALGPLFGRWPHTPCGASLPGRSPGRLACR